MQTLQNHSEKTNPIAVRYKPHQGAPGGPRKRQHAQDAPGGPRSQEASGGFRRRQEAPSRQEAPQGARRPQGARGGNYFQLFYSENHRLAAIFQLFYGESHGTTTIL